MSYRLIDNVSLSAAEISSREEPIHDYNKKLVEQAVAKGYLEPTESIEIEMFSLLDMVLSYNESLGSAKVKMKSLGKKRSQLTLSLKKLFDQDLNFKKSEANEISSLVSAVAAGYQIDKVVFQESISNQQTAEDLKQAIAARRYIYKNFKKMGEEIQFLTKISNRSEKSSPSNSIDLFVDVSLKKPSDF